MSKRTPLFFLFYLLQILGCSSRTANIEDRLTEVEVFVGHLSRNRPSEIYKMMYPVDPVDSIEVKESLRFKVSHVSELIAKNGLPPRETWTYSFDPNNILQRHVYKILVSYDSASKKSCIDLVVSYPPPEVTRTRIDFRVVKNLDCMKLRPVKPLLENMEPDSRR